MFLANIKVLRQTFRDLGKLFNIPVVRCLRQRPNFRVLKIANVSNALLITSRPTSAKAHDN